MSTAQRVLLEGYNRASVELRRHVIPKHMRITHLFSESYVVKENKEDQAGIYLVVLRLA